MDATTRNRLLPGSAVGAIVLVASLLVTLFALCCALDGDDHGADHHVDVAGPQIAPVAAGTAPAAPVAALRSGHEAHDCDHSFTVVAAAVAVPTPAPAPDLAAVVAAARAPGAGPSAGVVGASDRASPLTPVPHLLCVLRT